MERDLAESSVDLGPIDALFQFLNVEDKYTVAVNGLILLKALVMDPSRQWVEVESLASKVASIISCFKLMGMEEDMSFRLCRLLRSISGSNHMSRLIYEALMRFDQVRKPLGETQRKMDMAPLQSLFEHLTGNRSPVMSPLRKHVFRELAFLNAVVTDPRQGLVEYDALAEIEAMARNAGSIISAFEFRGMEQDMALQLCDLLKTSLTPLSSFMRKARDSLQGESPIYHIRIGQIRLIEHLVENLDRLVRAKVDSIGPLRFCILRLQRKLQYVSCHLRGIPESHKEDRDLKDLMKDVTKFACEAEFAIDSLLVRNISMFWCVFWLEDIFTDFKSYRRQVELESGDPNSIVRSIRTCMGNELTIIPIVNRSQISDFQLRQVFNHHNIVHTFSIRTWCLVSSYKERRKEIFLQVLNNVAYHGTYLDFDKGILWHPSCGPNVPQGDKVAYTSDMSEDELERSVATLLNRGSYFIILEDVLDIDVFNNIKRHFPNNDDGSRILLSTRSLELASRFRYGPQRVLSSKESTDHPSKSKTNKRIIDNDVVGFQAEIEGTLERLIRGPSKLHIISIVGMPGQGKTTLSKKLYKDPVVVNYFHTRAWCYVSQVYKKKELLLELLCQIVQVSDTIYLKNDEELAEMLYKQLKGQRFLIVMDDMWKVDAWDDLSRCFPNDNNGSRIVFTSRIQKLASQCKSDSILQFVYPLSDDESWKLLKKEVFSPGSCPSELFEVGERIAKKCKGLPLAVVLVAGCLKNMEQKGYMWEQIAENLTSRILSGEETVGKNVIELSYKQLPAHLKLCFLYCGAFLVDREISVSKLIRLWIAEGFVEPTELKSLEDVAEDYLMDLIARSLVAIAEEKSKGGVKTCHVHDLLHEFCLNKAKEENFLELINGSDSALNYEVDLYIGFDSPLIIYGDLHLLLSDFKMNYFIMLKPFEKLLRSILFVVRDMRLSSFYDMPFLFHGSKFLRILDLGDINIDNPFKAIKILVLLKYLALQGNVDLIPSSIVNLWNLETFLVKGLSATVVKVSNSILDMANLRHLHINDCATFDLESYQLRNSAILDNLQTFSTPSLAYGDDMENILRKIPGLRKLKCKFLDSWDDVTNCNQFPKLCFLNKLESLKVCYNGERKFPCQFNIPSNLKKLTLSNFRMPWSEISQLAILRNLEVLKLLSNAFEGETWEMEDEVFPKLKFLKLEALNIVKWSALSDHFPCLQCLLVHKCEQLEAIPPGIGDIYTLDMIEVIWSSTSAAISANQIHEEQLDFGNYGLKIHIHPKI